MTCRQLKFLLLEVLALSFIILNAPLTVFSNYKAVFSESTSTNRILYLNDSWNDVPRDLRTPEYAFAEIRRIEVENDSIIICANSTLENAPDSSYYVIFFDIGDFDNITDTCWGYTKYTDRYATPRVTKIESDLYRYIDKAFYFNGSWHPHQSSTAGNFEGKVAENETTGETTFSLGGIINGTVKIKVVSMTRTSFSGNWKGDLVPGGSLVDATSFKIQPLYRNPIDDAKFPYSNVTVELKVPETPPPPPPPPPPKEEVRMNFFVQMAVWAMQATVWIKEGTINLPFWMRDNAVSASLIVTVLVLSSYSLVKRWRVEKQRLKKLHAPLE